MPIETHIFSGTEEASESASFLNRISSSEGGEKV